MKEGDAEEETHKYTKELERSNEKKTFLNICEMTSHYSPLISPPAHTFIHQNYFPKLFCQIHSLNVETLQHNVVPV